MNRQKWKVRLCTGLIIASTFGGQCFVTEVANAEDWYSQKGIVYEGKTISSMCYISCYAMILSNLSFDATPVDVYVANGKSNYVDHSKLANYYNITSSSGNLSGLSAAKKKETIISLLKEHPEGVIVKGVYDGGSTHFIVARKTVDGQVYFDDPAFEKEEDGCCILLEKAWKVTWSNMTEYRVIDKADSEENQGTNDSNTSGNTSTPANETNNNTTSENYPTPTRTIYFTTPNMTGDDVKWVQTSLNTLGYTCEVDGIFGTASKNAVIAFQKDNTLTQDGSVGTLTRQKIISLLGEKDLVATGAATVKVGKVTNTSIKKKTVKKKIYSATYKWKALSNVTGYKVIYSTNSKFKNQKVKTYKKNTCNIVKLQKGKTYYFKVRGYKKVNNKITYGTYSAVKKIKIAK